KLFDPERFKDLITYCQIFLSFFVFLSYQIIPRWLSHTKLTGVASSPWLYLAPPTWFARMAELGIGRHSTENVSSAVLGGLAVVSTYAVLLRALSLSYVEQVSRLITIRREKAPKEPAAFWRRLKALLHRLVLPHSQERAIFYFIAHMF